MDIKKDTKSELETRSGINSLIFNVFEKDNFVLFLFKKLERIFSALYLVTNLLSDKEPLKWELREVGVRSIARVLSLKETPVSQSDFYYRVSIDVVKACSYLEVLYSSGSISEMNFHILKKELDTVLHTISFEKLSAGNVGSGKTLDSTFFAVDKDTFPVEGDVKVHSDNHNKTYTWKDLEKEVNKGHLHKGHTKINAPTVRSGTRTDSSLKGGVTPGLSQQDRLSRESKILELLSQRNNLTVRDFSSVIKGCSDKTIQRELLRLVQTGVLNKSGERRWSTYSLMSQKQGQN